MDSKKIWHFFSFYFSTIQIIFRYLFLIIQNLSRFPKYPFIRNAISDLFHAPVIVTFMDTTLLLYFHLCNLSPCTVDIDDQTTIHFFTPNHRKFNKPNLVLIHGYGGTSRWQFVHQVRPLSNRFNLYVPDLIFFGKSYSAGADRTEVFQAKCLVEGLKRLGVGRFSVYGISYGGIVAYHMAEMNPLEIDKVVIVSTAIGYTEEQKERQLTRIGRRISGFLVPESPQDLRFLVSLSMYRNDFLKWVPDFFFGQFINVSSFFLM